MAEICEYVAIKDAGFRLKVGEDKAFTFKLPNDTKINKKSILFYICNPTRDAVNLRFKVEINGKGVESVSVAERESAARTIHEVVNRNILKSGENDIEFKVLRGTGNITFSDVVILCKREVKN